jgi:hypothetical protein
VNQEIKVQWGEWLLANADKQGRGMLHRGNENENGAGDEYCCLGGLCELAVAAGIVTRVFIAQKQAYGYAAPGANPVFGLLPACVADWAGLQGINPVLPVLPGDALSTLNDGERTFPEIWALIDAQL